MARRPKAQGADCAPVTAGAVEEVAAAREKGTWKGGPDRETEPMFNPIQEFDTLCTHKGFAAGKNY